MLHDDTPAGQQNVPGPAAQFLDNVLIEFFDLNQLGCRYVGDLFDRRKPFLDQNQRDLFVNIELLRKELD